MKRMGGGDLKSLYWYGLTIGMALAVSGLLVQLAGSSWTVAVTAIVEGAFTSPGRWGATLAVATPMLMVALGTVVAVRAGLFNIGQEGQLLIGAMVMAIIGTRFVGPGPALLVLGLVMGALAGGGYAGVAGLIRYRRGVPEVITTLLLVFVAMQAAGFAVTTDWLLRDLDPNRPQRSQTSAALNEGSRLPELHLFGNDVSLFTLFALLIAIGVAVSMTRTRWGLRLEVLGSNPALAETIGVSPVRAGSGALFLSGAFAGLAGAAMLAAGASSYRFATGFSTNIGWQGLLVALLARGKPLLCIPVAVGFAALRTGGGFLASTGVDRRIVDVVQALLVMAFLIPPALAALRRRRFEGKTDAVSL